MSVNTKVNGQLVPSAGLYKVIVPIQSGDIYSFEERQVGVWADGKPVYQKTIYFEGTIPRNEWTNHNIANVDKIWVFDSVAKRDTDYRYNGINYFASDDYLASAVNKTQIYISYSTSTVMTEGYITLRYTKTTDVAGSGKYVPSGDKAVHYSEDEQVIGTWIDGSTLYRKVIPITSDIALTANTWVSTGISAPSVGRIVRCELINQSPANVTVSTAIQNDMWSLNSPRTIQVTGASTDWKLILEYTKAS